MCFLWPPLYDNMTDFFKMTLLHGDWYNEILNFCYDLASGSSVAAFLLIFNANIRYIVYNNITVGYFKV